MSDYNLSQLKQLEAESIFIFRDAISQFENPILLYSIGKDSSVLVRLAQKAFYPGKLPFKLLHIDSTWKFKEMLEFRDKFCAEQELDLIVHHNKKGKKAGPMICFLTMESSVDCSSAPPERNKSSCEHIQLLYQLRNNGFEAFLGESLGGPFARWHESSPNH